MTLESRTDFLTGLYNRRGFEAVFTRMVRRSNRNGNPLALYYIDSDSLKAINDNKGHDAGDRFIVDLGAGTERHAARIGFVIAVGRR